MKGDFFFEDGVQMRPYVGGATVGEETVEFGAFQECIHSFHYIEEELLALLFREAKRMEIDFVLPDIRPEVDSIFFIGDDIAEPVLPQGTQPERRLALMVLPPYFDGDDDMTPIGEGK